MHAMGQLEPFDRLQIELPQPGSRVRTPPLHGSADAFLLAKVPCDGLHERVVVNVEKFSKRVEKKIAR